MADGENMRVAIGRHCDGEVHLRPISSTLGRVLTRLPTFATHAFTELNVWEFLHRSAAGIIKDLNVPP